MEEVLKRNFKRALLVDYINWPLNCNEIDSQEHMLKNMYKNKLSNVGEIASQDVNYKVIFSQDFPNQKDV